MGADLSGTNPALASKVPLMPDADFVVIDDSQTPGYVNALKIEQRSSNCLTDSLLGGGMHLQPNDAERLPGRESHYVREIGIQRYEHAAVFNREAQDLLVGSSGEANLKDRNSIVPLRSQFGGMLWGEVFIQKKLHWVATTISSAARRAAYSRLALMCSGLSCG